jgi:Tfp pilus assembly protein PilF
VRRDAKRVRVTAQLIETVGESQVWADTYERDLTDCFMVQADIASRIARALSLELLPDSRRETGRGTHDPAAYQAYLKGRFHWNNSADTALPQAIAYFQQAIALDQSFAAAYSSLGRAHVLTARAYLAKPRAALEAARAAATRALQLDDTDANAHLTLAEVRNIADWDWTLAEDAYRLALSCNPSHEGAHRLYGLFLAERGRQSEAALAAERARELDPLCLTVNTTAAWVRYFEGEYGATVSRCRHTLDMEADFIPASRLIASAMFQMGRVEEAIAELEAVRSRRVDPASIASLAHMRGVTGRQTHARGLVRELEALSAERYVSPYYRALAYAGLGDADAVFAALGAACEDRDPGLLNVAVEPMFAQFRTDDRYCALVKRLGLV